MFVDTIFLLHISMVAAFLSNSLHDTVFDLCLQSIRNAIESCHQSLDVLAGTKGAVSLDKKVKI